MVVGERRSSASCGRRCRTAQAESTVGRVARRARPAARCGSASGPTARPASTAPAGRWSRSALDLRRDRGRRRWPAVRRCRGRRRVDGRARRRDAAPRGRRPHRRSPTAPLAHAAALGRARRRRGRSPLEQLRDAIADADLVVPCTGVGRHRGRRRRRAPTSRRPPRRPPAVRPRPGAAARRRPRRRRRCPACTVVDLDSLRGVLERRRSVEDVEAVRAHRRRRGRRATSRRQRAVQVAPTVVALRTGPQQVVDAELRPAASAGCPTLDERADARGRAHGASGSSTSCCTRRPCG